MTQLSKLFEVMHESLDASSPEEIANACEIIVDVQSMKSDERECIRAGFTQGPLFDGDVPSKSGRDSMLKKGYMAKVVVRGEDGFNACTHKGAIAYRLLEVMGA